jgi:hypothetical protein
MNRNRVLLSAALLTTILGGLTACSTPPATPPESSTPSASENVVPPSDDEKQLVIRTYTDFLDSVYQADSAEAEAIFQSAGDVDGLTDETKQSVVDQLEEKYSFLTVLDTEGLPVDTIGGVYSAYLLLGAEAKNAGANIEVLIPEEAVTIEEETATVDMAQATILVNDEPSNNTVSTLEMHKRDGVWFIDPGADEQQAEEAPVEELPAE